MASPIVRITGRGAVRDANSHPLCPVCRARMSLADTSGVKDLYACALHPVTLSKPAPGTEPNPLSTGITSNPYSDLRLPLSPGGDR